MAVTRTIPAGDVALSNHQLVLIGDLQYLRQKLAARLKFFLGEWFLDLRQGIPYYRDVFVKNPNLRVVRSLMRRVILRTPGIVDLPKFEIIFNEAERNATFEFEAVAKKGRIVVLPSDRDFLVDLAA
jgi:hypothetical protein